jgi:hypothetical protein
MRSSVVSDLRRSDLDPMRAHLGASALRLTCELQCVLRGLRPAAPCNRRRSDLDPTPEILGSCSSLRGVVREPKQDQELSVSPSGCPSHFLLRAQEKVTKEKGTPRPRPQHIPVLGVRDRWLGFSTGHPWPGENLGRIHTANPSGISASARRSRGAPLQSAGSCPQETKQARVQVIAKNAYARSSLLSPSPLEGEGLGRGGNPRKRINEASFGSSGQEPALLRGPWGAAGGGRIARRVGRMDAAKDFDRPRMACPKSPTASRELSAHGCAEGADEGWPFFGLPFFGHAKKGKSGRPKDGPKAPDLALASSAAAQCSQEQEPSRAGVGSRSDLRGLDGAAGRNARLGCCESRIRALVHSPRALIGTRTSGPRACLLAPKSRLFSR